MHPVSFRNVTDDFEMRMVDVLALDRIDPDTDLKSGPENVAVIKWNGTNTNWTVQLWPTPDTNSETIKDGPGTYTSENLTDTLAGGKYKGTIELR